MGVPAFHTNRFTAARQYAAALEKQQRDGGPPVRRDLELEAIAEIIRGERLIHCHSYRQDEIVAFLRVMESFGVRVATLQHILEGYKVADEIAKHGAAASAFADWWAYKFEVYDAIPSAGSIMRERGVNVSFNSDDSDLARRMNLEAAKAVKYGGTPEEEALKFVTINPAQQLGIDRMVGSLEAGKDGDFAVWTGNPLATSSVCLETWIDGKQYFEREAARRRGEARNAERLTLIDKAQKLATEPDDDPAAAKAQEKFFFRALEDRGVYRCAGCCLDHQMPWKN
jgi:N-acetylglucosamine-6-phosphate deacetylase